MTVNQHRRQALRHERVRLSDCEDREIATLAEVSYVAAKLAIARWSYTSRHSHRAVDVFHHDSSRVRWYAYVQRGLHQWIAQGGFAQDETDDGWAMPAEQDGQRAKVCAD